MSQEIRLHIFFICTRINVFSVTKVQTKGKKQSNISFIFTHNVWFIELQSNL